MYDGNELETAVEAIHKIEKDEALRQRLFAGGIKTADERSWDNCMNKILGTFK